MKTEHLEVIGFLHQYGVNGLRFAKQENRALWASFCHSSKDRYGKDAVPLFLPTDTEGLTQASSEMELIGYLDWDSLVNLRQAQTRNAPIYAAPCHPSSVFGADSIPIYIEAAMH